jgi:putative transposase
MAILRWSQDSGVEWHYVAPGKTAAERLYRELQCRLHDELLNETLFSSLAHARAILTERQLDYNTFDRTAAWAICRQPITPSSAPGTQRDGSLCAIRSYAPRPVAAPSQTSSNDQPTLLIPG